MNVIKLKSKLPIIFLAFANEGLKEEQYLRNLPFEQKNIRKGLKAAEKAGLCEIIFRPNITLDEIVETFQEYGERIVIFHFGGHSNSYEFLLEDPEGNTQSIDSRGLCQVFSQRKSLKLVFLNGCASEKQALDLVEGGIPLVIGTSKSVDDKLASELATVFYQGLGFGNTIEQAWRDAEGTIKSKIDSGIYRSIYWGETENTSGLNPWKLHERPGCKAQLEWNLPKASKNPLFGLPKIPEKYYLRLPRVPFRNILPFVRAHAGIFFGRGEEIQKLYKKIKSIHPLILFYGQSGVGKSSMLDAGLFPRLEEEYQIRYLRRIEEGAFKSLQALIGFSDTESIREKWLEIEAMGKPLIIILDQLEEAYTKSTGKNAEEELKEFFQLLDECFNSEDEKPKGKLILSYRKEYHPEIEDYVVSFNLPYTDFFLQRINRHGIIEAVKGITEEEIVQGKYKVEIESSSEGDLASIIADDLLEDAESALTPILQILLNRMWENMEDKKFTLKLYKELKREGLLLKDFFDRQIKSLKETNPEAVESGLVLDILYSYTTEYGTSNSQPDDEIIGAYTHLEKSFLPLLKMIEEKHLIRTLDKSIRSLSHDTLAGLVRNRFAESNLPGQTATRILDNALRNKAKILSKDELSLVLKGEKGRRKFSIQERSLVQKSTEKYEKELIKDNIKGLIRENEIDKALDALVKYFGSADQSGELLKEIELLYGRYYRLKQMVMIGLIRVSYEIKTKNEIVDKLLYLTDKIGITEKKDFAQKIQKLISQNSIGEALAYMKEYFESNADDELFNSYTIISHRYRAYKSKVNSGLYSPENRVQEETKIINALLAICSQMEHLTLQVDTPQKVIQGEVVKQSISLLYPVKLEIKELIQKDETLLVKDHVKTLLMNNEFGEAIAVLNLILESGDFKKDLVDAFVKITDRFVELEQNGMTIGPDNEIHGSEVSKNQIVNHLLNITNEIFSNLPSELYEKAQTFNIEKKDINFLYRIHFLLEENSITSAIHALRQLLLAYGYYDFYDRLILINEEFIKLNVLIDQKEVMEKENHVRFELWNICFSIEEKWDVFNSSEDVKEEEVVLNETKEKVIMRIRDARFKEAFQLLRTIFEKIPFGIRKDIQVIMARFHSFEQRRLRGLIGFGEVERNEKNKIIGSILDIWNQRRPFEISVIERNPTNELTVNEPKKFLELIGPFLLEKKIEEITYELFHYLMAHEDYKLLEKLKEIERMQMELRTQVYAGVLDIKEELQEEEKIRKELFNICELIFFEREGIKDENWKPQKQGFLDVRKIRLLLRQEECQEVIDILLNYFSIVKSQLVRDVWILASRFNSIKHKRMIGIIDAAIYDEEMTAIHYGILQLCEQIEATRLED